MLFKKKRVKKSETSNIGVELTDEMNSLLIDISNNKKSIYFVNGGAGTGKSTFIREFYKQNKENTICLAPTGVAALNIKGQTIHSFFKLKPEIQLLDNINKNKDPKIYKNIKYLVIDEISMVRADLLDAIDISLKKNRNESNLWFGGVKLIVIGDIYQLPPILKGSDKKIWNDRFSYKTRYFFSARSFRELLKENEIGYYELNKFFRQNDYDFLNVLNKIRKYEIDDVVGEKLDSRLLEDEENIPEKAIILTTTNKQAKYYNFGKMKQLESEEYIFNAKIEGIFPESNYPNDEKMFLKIGAKIILIKNIGNLVNGTIGIVKNIDKKNGVIEIVVDGKAYYIQTEKWENYKYIKKDNKIERICIGEFKQFPIKLGWAITIHKSQGLTLDEVLIDTQKSAFESGQVYVALSRCKEFKKLYLKGAITGKDIIEDPEIIKAEKYIRENCT